MIYKGKFKIINSPVAACDYQYIQKQITQAVKSHQSLVIHPVTSHTLTIAKYDPEFTEVLNSADYLLPDSQWVKRALNFLHGVYLKERVYGPDLMLRACDQAAKA